MNFKQAMDHMKRGSASSRIRRAGWHASLSMSKDKLYYHVGETKTAYCAIRADLEATDWEAA